MAIISQDSVANITDLETLKVISDPLRLNILQIVGEANKRDELCSVKQISEQLEMPPAKLYYHVRMLEKHNLLLVAETRLVSGIVEKLYRVQALQIMVSNELFALQESGDSLSTMFAGLFYAAQKEIQRNLQKYPTDALQKHLSIASHRLDLTPARLEELIRRMENLLKEYTDTPETQEEEKADRYNLLFALYPVEIHWAPVQE
jgi:DNA-binding transcriptional ArsR family regulator